MNQVTINGSSITLNQSLIEKQKLDMPAIAAILGLHARKLALYAEMAEAEEFSLEAYGRELRDIEYALQREWKFPQTAKYHRFWEAPRCTCPKMDNEEHYGTAYAIIDKACPVHGENEYE